MADSETKQKSAPPTDLSKLTPEQIESVQNWLHEKWKNRTCPICSDSRWTVSPDLIAPPLLRPRAIMFGGTLYPLVQLFCQNCGHAHFFSAVLMGLFPEKTGGSDD